MSGLSIFLTILDIWQGLACPSGIEYARDLSMSQYSYNNSNYYCN